MTCNRAAIQQVANERWYQMKIESVVKNLIISFLVAYLLISPGSAVVYSGIDFPDGANSFADAVVSYSPTSDVVSPYNDPSTSLGIPDYPNTNSFVSLGDAGILILKFTDNSLTTSGNSDEDLWVFEIGDAIEPTYVYISTDGTNWISVGSTSGATSGVDIDAYIGSGVTLGTQYSYVKLVDDDSVHQSGSPYEGADIDAVGAISSAPPVPDSEIPEFPTIAIPIVAIIGLMSIFQRRTGK